MTISSEVVVQDPIDGHELFFAALEVVGLSKETDWRLEEFGDSHMLLARANQGAEAVVSTHFTADGNLYPADSESDQPDGYALVLFNTSSAVCRADHERLVRRLGQWLTDRGLRWSWTYMDEPWMPGDRAGEETPTQG